MQRAFKFFLYGSWFWFVLFVCAYLTFPLSPIKTVIKDRLEIALGKGDPIKVGKHGVNPVVTIGDLSLYRLSGLSMSRVKIQLASNNPDPGPSFFLDELNVRVGILSLLTDEKSISFSGDLYEGSFSGDADVNAKGTLYALNLDIDGLRVDKAIALQQMLGGPLGGVFGASVELELGPEPQKNAEGEIVIKAEKLSAGPGDFKFPGAPLPVNLPYIDLGVLDGNIEVKKGSAKSKTFALTGGDATAEFDLTAKLQKRLNASRLNGGGWLLVDEDFLAKPENSKLKSAMEIAAQMGSKARDKEGRFHFELKGTMGKPRFSPSKTAGKRRNKK